MNELHFLQALFIAIIAGVYGSMLGLGGGIILVPALIAVMHVEPRAAVAASIVSVIATSCAGAVAFVRERYANVELGILLESTTTIGALTGTFVALRVSGETVAGVFAILLIYATYMVLRPTPIQVEAPKDAKGLTGSFFDKTLNKEVVYRVVQPQLGMAAGVGAGMVSALLGVGGGLIMVPVMTSLMGVPVRAAAATSNFMIGVTAVATAVPYYAFGEVDVALAAPCAIGVLFGARIGARLAPRTPAAHLRYAFAAVLLYTAFTMARRAGWAQ